MAARPPLLHQLPAVAEVAFGERVDVEGLVSHEGDVLIRVRGVARQAAHLRAAAAADGERPELWPRARLVPLGVLNDHQALAANWDALGHLLLAAPIGQGAATALAALLAPLLARATPDELGLKVIASPGSPPAELLAVPHLSGPVVDPRQPEAVQAAVDRVQAELERRRAAQPNAEVIPEPDLVLVVRELAELDTDTLAGLGPILLDGPPHGIRLLAVSERPAAELQQACPVLGEFGTRLVSQVADEDESVALLGVAGAETLGTGGRLLVRLEGRLPVQVYGYRVAPDRLARLVELMGTAEVSPPPPSEPAAVDCEPAEGGVAPTGLGPTEERGRSISVRLRN
jgi:DNA segregation ATPase FtsK/SpoIIIE-like protein